MRSKSYVWPGLLYIISSVIFFSSCSPTKHLAENEILLNKNRIFFPEGKPDDRRISKRELSTLFVQEPNQKFLGLFKFRLWVYNKASGGKETGLKWWLKENIGEPPVLLDTPKVVQTSEAMEAYLRNKGYFYGDVHHTIQVKKQKATVNYCIYPNQLFRFDSISFPEPENRVARIIDVNKEESLLNPGDPFDLDVLKAERLRITEDMKNAGYYDFSKEYIYYEIDSNDEEHTLSLDLKVHSPAGAGQHPIYFINDVFVHTDYTLTPDSPRIALDTLHFENYIFIAPEHEFNPQVLISNIFFEKGTIYQRMDFERTVRRFSEMEVFTFVNVQYEKILREGKNLLNVYVYLTPAKKNQLGVETQVYMAESIDREDDGSNNTSNSNLGIGINYNYKRRNMFSYADVFTFKQSLGIEPQFTKPDSASEEDGNQKAIPLNTLDISTSMNILFPKFIFFPLDFIKISKAFNPKTRIGLSHDYIRRIQFYTFRSARLNFGYDWREFKAKRHILNLVSLSSVVTSHKSRQFQRELNRRPFLKKSFENQFIIGSNYTFIFNNSKVEQVNNPVFFRGSLDVAGNSLFLLNKIFPGGSEGPDSIMGRPYSQYIRPEADFRFYQIFNPRRSMVYRIAAGVGVPYGNSEVLPYIKQFFVGGSNSLRAWKLRSLGPGSYTDTTHREGVIFFDQTGDIKLEGNIEYRFDLSRSFEGALFVDAGNVWLINNEDTVRAREGLFEFPGFWREIAVGTGFGIRWDFTFFILRFDFGFKAYDPAQPEGERWVLFKNFTDKSVPFTNKFELNLAVGYPF